MRAKIARERAGRPELFTVFVGVDIGAESRRYSGEVSKRVAVAAGGVRPTWLYPA
jgi:hypothetical protein